MGQFGAKICVESISCPGNEQILATDSTSRPTTHIHVIQKIGSKIASGNRHPNTKFARNVTCYQNSTSNKSDLSDKSALNGLASEEALLIQDEDKHENSQKNFFFES